MSSCFAIHDRAALRRATACLTVMLACASASAELTISFVPLSESTNPQIPASLDEEEHAADFGSARLLNVLEYVGGVFEDAFEVDHEIEITYLWDQQSDFAGQAPPNWVNEEDGQITHAVVRFHPTGFNWYIDNSPANHSEFQPLGQVLFESLSPSDQTQRFTGDTPAQFEAGFNAPAVSGGAANGQLDLVTVAFQEVGHAIGLSSGFSALTNAAGNGEADDGVFDVPTAWVNGDTMGILPLGTGSNGPLAHLAGDDAVMASLGGSERTLPSTADYMAIALTNGWNNLDLPRKDFIADGGDWRLGAYWLGGRAPDAQDDAYLRNGGQVTSFANIALLSPVARNLTIQNGSSLSTGDDTVTIGNDVLVEAGASGLGATLNVEQDGRLNADDIALGDGGLLSVTSGRVTADVFDVNSGGQLTVGGPETVTLVDVNALNVRSGGLLVGNGDVFAGSLRNSGAIVAVTPTGGDMLRLFADNTGVIDLDGAAPFDGAGDVFAVLGDIAVVGAVSDAFDGEMTVGAGRRIAFAGPWQIGDNVAFTQPVVNLNGGATSSDAARLTGLPGADITAHAGEINVSGWAIIDSAIEFDSSVEVNVDGGGTLRLTGGATLDGGTFAGEGSVQFNSDTVVTATTTIDTAIADLDGGGGSSEVTINSYDLRLNVDRIDTLGTANAFDGVMNINGSFATLDVELNDPNDSWRLDGVVNINGGPLPQPLTAHLEGSRIEVAGQINADGVATVTADLDIAGGVTTVDPSSRLQLTSGHHVLRDTASVTGPGELRIGGPATLQLEDGAAVAVDTEVSGRLEPGVGVGQASVFGDVDMTGFAAYAVELAGDAYNDEYDQLHVFGNADVDGEFELSLVDGYVPDVGTIFTVLTGDAVTGTFDDVTTLTDGFYNFHVDVNYLPQRVTVEFLGLFLPGDYNDDGTVDAADYVTLRDAQEQPGAVLPNDLVGGPIGDGHYEQWRQHYGASLASIFARGNPGVVGVPEPSAAVLLVAAATLLRGHPGRRNPDATRR